MAYVILKNEEQLQRVEQRLATLEAMHYEATLDLCAPLARGQGGIPSLYPTATFDPATGAPTINEDTIKKLIAEFEKEIGDLKVERDKLTAKKKSA
jgi:hypothetical protein